MSTTVGFGGRNGLEPASAWYETIKWQVLSLRQVAAETGISSLWSWGWGTFGPDSTDPDKAAAACVWLWARDQTLCDGPATAGPSFVASLTEGQIVLPAGVHCTFGDGGRVLESDVRALQRLTGDRHTAVTAAFARAVLQTAAPVTAAQVLTVERKAIARGFHGDRRAYLRALARRHATVGLARGVIRDELRRRAIAARLGSTGSTLAWTNDRESAAAANAICRGDDLPVPGPIELDSYVPFLAVGAQPLS
jgi:hypothetical protein